MFEFQRAAADLLGAEATVYSDGALRNQHVSPDPVTVTSLSATSAGRHALLELEALPGAIEALRDEGNAAQFDR